MPRRTMMMATVLAISTSVSFAQQQPAYTFRLEKSERNPGSCMALDATMSRQHTVTIVGDTAVVKSAGGIDDVAKQVTPGVYRTKFSTGGATLDIVFDKSASPVTLSASEPKLGCKWSGAAS